MQSASSAALSPVLSAQNQDGGWGYRGGSSWTEPTAFALLALAAWSEPDGPGTPIGRGLAWLGHGQRADGGWGPHLSVDQSTWVTAPAALALAGCRRAAGLDRAIAWLTAQTGRESGALERLRAWLLDARGDIDTRYDGWPWFPGAAAWVAPTALTILALEKAARLTPSRALRARVDSGRGFLLARRCGDGGWNHGANRALGQTAASYPETTGLALLALHGAAVPSDSVACARRHLETCRSSEARSWLELGLRGQGIAPPDPQQRPIRSSLAASLALLAAAAGQGRNVLL